MINESGPVHDITDPSALVRLIPEMTVNSG